MKKIITQKEFKKLYRESSPLEKSNMKKVIKTCSQNLKGKGWTDKKIKI